VRMAADATALGTNQSTRIDELAPMPAAITGRLTSLGEVSQLAASLPLDGPDTRIDLVLSTRGGL
jgi:hypothetical protein